MEHVKWVLPELEQDHTVHFLLDAERTLCGCAYEGVHGGTEQGFIAVKKKVSCAKCIEIVEECLSVKTSEMLRK